MRHEPMHVRRVQSGSGYNIDPPLNSAWSHLDQLRWKAAVVSLDTGLDVRIETGNLRQQIFGRWGRRGRWVTIRGQYDVAYANGSGLADVGTYNEAWSWLNGFMVGAQQQRREVTPDAS